MEANTIVNPSVQPSATTPYRALLKNISDFEEKPQGNSVGYSVFLYLKSTVISVGYFALSIGLLLGVWAAISVVLKETIPGPVATLTVFWELVKDPFYDYGPNDKGIGLQLFSSLGRVFKGFLLGSLVAIPLGVLIGSSKVFNRIFYPIIQILRPVSPLAWFPIGLAAMQDSGAATIFIIFITSLWPTLVNTAFGVGSIPKDHKNVAKAFGFSTWRYLTKVLIPYSLPHIITGLRLSIGIAWLVIVAGEMLSGGMGIGFFVWDSWNALSLERVICAILIIGLVGLFLDRLFTIIQNRFAYAG